MPIKKILFLGASRAQLPVIQYAKDIGLYVITADYLPNNLGHKLADESYNISTTNKDAILDLATTLQIDAISAYASDPAAPTAAYVSETLNIVGSPCSAVETLSNKNLFRKFLIKHGFKTPNFIVSEKIEEILDAFDGQKAIIKPVDSSGSKGIFIINSTQDIFTNFEIAKSYSRTGSVILESFIERKGPQIHGEGFVQNGDVKFILLGDQHFSPINPIAPYSTIVPSQCHNDVMPIAEEMVKRIISALGYLTGGINIEIIRDVNDDLYILEIGARNGGNFMPQLMLHATGFDLVKANIDALFAKDIPEWVEKKVRPHAQIILHASKDGVYNGLAIPKQLKGAIKEETIYYPEGTLIKKYENSKDVVGVLIIALYNPEMLLRYSDALKNNKWLYTQSSKDIK